MGGMRSVLRHERGGIEGVWHFCGVVGDGFGAGGGYLPKGGMCLGISLGGVL